MFLRTEKITKAVIRPNEESITELTLPYITSSRLYGCPVPPIRERGATPHEKNQGSDRRLTSVAIRPFFIY